MINVSTEVKALVESEAKAVCVATKLKNDQFNQEMNAITAFRCLKKSEVVITEQQTQRVLQILHKCGNASALRQAISTEAKKQGLAVEIANELLTPTK